MPMIVATTAFHGPLVVFAWKLSITKIGFTFKTSCSGTPCTTSRRLSHLQNPNTISFEPQFLESLEHFP